MWVDDGEMKERKSFKVGETYIRVCPFLEMKTCGNLCSLDDINLPCGYLGYWKTRTTR